MKLFFIIFLLILCLGANQFCKDQENKVDINEIKPSQENKPNIYEIKPSTDKNAPSKIYIPANLNDCFVELKKILHPELIEKLKNSADGKVGDAEVVLTSWIAENWELRENSRLAKYFENYLQIAKQYEGDKNVSKELLAKTVIPEETANFIVIVFKRYLKGDIKDAESYMEFVKGLRNKGVPPNFLQTPITGEPVKEDGFKEVK